MSKIILASNSPRRRELLAQIGICCEVIPSNADENVAEPNPKSLVEKLSKRKAFEVAQREEVKSRLVTAATEEENSLLVIGADTVVVMDNKILGKPSDEKEAFDMLWELQGRTHFVYTGVTLVKGTEDGSLLARTFYGETAVEVASMTKEEILDYIASKEPMDKAGAYGIQGAFGAYIKGIHGDYYNVVGLPLCQLMQEIKNF